MNVNVKRDRTRKLWVVERLEREIDVQFWKSCNEWQATGLLVLDYALLPSLEGCDAVRVSR